MGWVKATLIRMIRVYQYVLAPLFWGCCRFTPSCSEYAIQALEAFPASTALVLVTRRLLRCHPFCSHAGCDPIPDRKDKSWT